MTDRTKELENVKQEVREIIVKYGDQIPPKAAPLIEEAIAKIKVDKMAPKEVLAFPPPIMEMMYQQGYNFFQGGKYKDALAIFDVLRMLDLGDSRYTFAIAGCYHYSKEYLDAAANYMIYKVLNPLDPISSFHLYDCFMKANYPLSALFYIEEALILAEKDPKYSVLKGKIILEREHLKGFLKKHYQQKYGTADAA